ncbi:hypothetical protein RDABS01_022910 [Bienertia sinuspersici]
MHPQKSNTTKMAATATATATATAALMLLLIFCCAYANAEAGGSLSSSTSFTDENPIKLVSDVDFEVESSSHISTSILHEPHEYDDAAASFSPRRKKIKAIYQFGDSISDTGNLIREDPSNSIANLPYGQTFFHKSTGRASNGLLMIDFFCMIFLIIPHDRFLDDF